MLKIIAFLKQEKIQISISIGLSIILLAYVSKAIMQVEFSYLELAAPGFFLLFYEGASKNKKFRKFVKPVYAHILIWLVTAIVIFRHLI